MPSRSNFVNEKSISVDDHGLRKALGPLAKKNHWAALVVDFYDDAKAAQRSPRKALKGNVKRHPDGLPKLTFAVFDGCVIRHYLDETKKHELGAVLLAIGVHAKAPRAGVNGVANFCLDGGGDDFWFLLDYEKKAVFMQYEETVTIDFRDERAKAATPATPLDAWARVFELGKTKDGQAQLIRETAEAKRAALPGVHLRVGPSQELISIEPIRGETTKVRWYHGHLTSPHDVGKQWLGWGGWY